MYYYMVEKQPDQFHSRKQCMSTILICAQSTAAATKSDAYRRKPAVAADC